MRLFRGLTNLKPFTEGCVLTVGNFDGVHKGHQRVLANLNEKAKALGLPSVVMIFEPQPKEWFDPDQAPARLSALSEKLSLLAEEQVDAVAIMAFNARFRGLSAQAFVDQVLLAGLNVKALIVGDDFRFGCDRSGDFQFLHRAGEAQGFSVVDTKTLAVDGDRVSSTRLRECLLNADLEEASNLLGRPYFIQGKVAHGQKLGRQLGVPTANIILKRTKAPLVGVFAVTAKVVGVARNADAADHNTGDRPSFQGVANIGLRPTVGGVKPILEAHLFDFDGDLYGQRLQVTFEKKIRDEKRFNGLDELKAAIHNDIKQAKAYFTC